MKVYNDISLLSATFNRHDFTYNMLVSLYKRAQAIMPIYILDNSDVTSFESPSNNWVHIIDNTNYKHSPNYNQPSKNHCASIEYALFNVIPTKYVLLVDNDIIFQNTITHLLDCRFQYDLIGEIGHDIVPGDRLFPYMCIIDLDWVKANRIHYFDEPRCITEQKTMDTGASFLEDCLQHNSNIYRIQLANYVVHLKGGTLHNKSMPPLK